MDLKGAGAGVLVAGSSHLFTVRRDRPEVALLVVFSMSLQPIHCFAGLAVCAGRYGSNELQSICNDASSAGQRNIPLARSA